MVYKRDSVTGDAIPGCLFQLRYLGGETSGSGGTVIGTYQTSQNGSFTVTGLKVGYYICEELESDSGHVIDSAPQSFYISGKDQDIVTLYFSNAPKGAVLVKKVSAADNSPLSDVEFLVTKSDGSVVGDANGKFVTDSTGTFLVEGVEPGTTLVIKEIRAKDGYLLDDTPQTVQVKEGQTVTVEFRNQPMGNLIIHKLSSKDKTPLEGVQFKITYADGSYLPDEGGKLSSNGLYWTNAEGQIILSGITGTVVVTEVESIPGYTIDPDTQSQTVVVDPDDTQELYFYNAPVGGVELTKVNEADKTERIPNTTFEIRRVSDDVLVDTVTTGKDGRAYLSLESGDYYAVETEAADGFKLDDTPIYFTVKDGETTRKTVTNKAFSGIHIHKVDPDGRGIPGVTFLLYDSGKNPIGQYTSDNRGYVYIDDLTESGRYYLRELENEGYVPDTELKTVYVKSGRTTEITWENIPITGQIQIIKKSADYNPTNGLPAGTLLEGAVFEIYDKAGNVVDTIRSDSRGRAVSKQLPLSRYTIREVKAPDHYGVNETELTAYLEHEGQIVRFEVTNKSLTTGVAISKAGPKEVVSGQPVRYTFSGIANTSNVRLDSFYWRDTLPAAVTLDHIITGSYNSPGVYKVVYKVNNTGSYRTLADNLSTSQTYTLAASPAALGLAANERVTEIMFVFGQVPAGFAQVEAPVLYCTAVNGLAAGSSFVNAYGYHDVTALVEDSMVDGEIVVDKQTGKKDKKAKKDPEIVLADANLNKTSTVVKDFVIDYTVATMDPLYETESTTDGLEYRYVYGLDDVRLSVTVKGVENGAGHIIENGDEIRLYYHQDLRGTVDYLTSPVSGKVESWTHYNEWGEITHNAVLKCGQRELDLVKNYTGHEYDAVLGMYYAKARFYDAAARRFISMDPVKGDIKKPLTLIQYLYVENNPLIQVDPLGKEAATIKKIKNLQWGGISSRTYNGSVYYSVREIFDALGGIVIWDDSTKQADLSYVDSSTITKEVHLKYNTRNVKKNFFGFAKNNTLFNGDLYAKSNGVMMDGIARARTVSLLYYNKKVWMTKTSIVSYFENVWYDEPKENIPVPPTSSDMTISENGLKILADLELKLTTDPTSPYYKLFRATPHK